MSLPQRQKILRAIEGLDDDAASVLEFRWSFWARPNQIPPHGDWRYWLILAGRGFGKTRAGAEWVRDQVLLGRQRIALIGPTTADVRDVMIEGESGLIAISPPWDRPRFEPSKRRLTWPNGATAYCYSAQEPERLRGPQHDAAWADELAAWIKPEAVWDQLQLGLRIGDDPRAAVTTTPRPLPLIRQLVDDPNCVISRGSTYDNQGNLAPAFIERIIARYEGTRLGRQELHAEILSDVPGALWSIGTLVACRVASAPDLVRVVVAVDPSGSSGRDAGDAQGIVVAGLGVDGRGYVLADRTCKLSPEGWGRRTVEAFDAFGADRIVAERNFGGDMVRSTLQAVRATAPVTLVTASRGKVVRAEPVSALYEQGRVSHVVPSGLENPLADLEAELRQATANGYLGQGSPNRLDALVWALTELMLKKAPPGAAFLELARREVADRPGQIG
ncbi:DNA-packaging protein [Phenylobacterium montanum]|uniref:DNA-packaging protein n=1 Tax=Phenylobacterium montanum TaxID=2823693 RepID=UPI002012B690|nr:terminase family protein [Caulobacter sp. S6]